MVAAFLPRFEGLTPYIIDAAMNSGRSFGLLLSAVFALLGLYPLIGGGSLRLGALVGAVIILAIALSAPGLLSPLARLWLRLGDVLHRLVSPVVLGFIYFGVICPFGLAMRMARRDALKLSFDKTAATYWVARDPAGPEPESIRNQF
jgi:hypothetical protein